MSFDWSDVDSFSINELYGSLLANVTSRGTRMLKPHEVPWLLRSSALEKQGFVLRPRYRVGWEPSWWTNGRGLYNTEDAIYPFNGDILDATRVSDGTQVLLKAIPKGRESEVAISRFLSSPELLQNPHNHCLRIYDVLQDPLNPEGSLLVTQGYLRPACDSTVKPDFVCVGEVIDFIQQTLEAVDFIHRQGVAHGRITEWKVMMDARCLFPRGHHPIEVDKEPDGVTDAHALPRIDKPVRYYLVDFSKAAQVPPGDPCILEGGSCDAFKADMHSLGNIYLTKFTLYYEPLRPLKPLVAIMMHDDPNLRPSATEALSMFRSIRRVYFRNNRYDSLRPWWKP